MTTIDRSAIGSLGLLRADAFRRFYERGGHEPMLDALTDPEADPVMRGWLVEHLRLRLR
jgi:hypothetical protein